MRARRDLSSSLPGARHHGERLLRSVCAWLLGCAAFAALGMLPLAWAAEGLVAKPSGLAPNLLSVPGESMLINPAGAAANDDDDDMAVTPDEIGLASWYGAKFHKRRTASGELFDMRALTAAHPTLPFGSRVCVRSQATGRTVVVRINDRGPHTGKRVIDLSRAAAETLGMVGLGLKPVELYALEDDEQDCPEP